MSELSMATPEEVKEISEKIMEKYDEAIKNLASGDRKNKDE